ncbi:MAG: hypothetical protein QNJ35_04925 [Paracoccaceae bacterium]|nr:hypothetical protein [Paracoccaceae bacterium]
MKGTLMDPIALVFYAVVCGLLSAFAPNFGGRMQRLGIGAAVGVAAAAFLPVLRGMIGL